MLSRVIVCKMGRLGELRKIVDCQTSQLMDMSEEQNNVGQVKQSICSGQEIQSNCVNVIKSSNNYSDPIFSQTQSSIGNQVNHLSSENQVNEYSDGILSGNLDQSNSFLFNMNQNFEGIIFENEFQGKSYFKSCSLTNKYY